MADLSSYSPIYVRSNGSDSTGDGSSGSPYLTAQKAFEIAYAGTGNKVLDFGVGNFGGVNLTTANASDWPSRIAVRGVGATQSFLGDINADGASEVYDFENYATISPVEGGKNISIISDKSITLGNINSNGGQSVWDIGGSGGAVTLTDSTSANISSNGGGGDNGGSGGNVSLTNSASDNISSNGGGGNTLSGGGGGAVTLTDSTSANISSNGGGSLYQVGNHGAVILSGSTIIPNLITAGYVDATNLRKGRGVNGSSILGLV